MTNEYQLQLAAEYGLNLLEEKGQLEQRCQSLEIELDETRNQLKYCQQIKFDQVLKIEQIENEYQTRENDFREEIINYKQQIRAIQQDNQHLIEENQRLEQIIEQSTFDLKFQLKQLEIKQEHQAGINNSLVEENELLREQNDQLAQHLIHYEQLKNEHQFLQDQFEEHKRQSQSLTSFVDHLQPDLHATFDDDDDNTDFNDFHQILSINEQARILFHKIRNLSENKSLDEIDFDDTSSLLSYTIDLFDEYINSPKQNLNLSNDSKEYQDQIVKLRLLLITKHEQIEVLRQLITQLRKKQSIEHQGKFISPAMLQ